MSLQQHQLNASNQLSAVNPDSHRPAHSQSQSQSQSQHPFRHKAHSSVSSETPSYTVSHEGQEDSQFPLSDDGDQGNADGPASWGGEEEHEEALWDSLDEEDEDEDVHRTDFRTHGDRRSGRKQRDRNRNRSRGSTAGGIGGDGSGSVSSSTLSTDQQRTHQHQTASSLEATANNREATHSPLSPSSSSESVQRHNRHIQHSMSRSGSNSPRQSPGKAVPVTSSFYNWAANTPNSLTMMSKTTPVTAQKPTRGPRDRERDRRDEESNGSQQQQQQPLSPQRLIDATHQELLESIDRQAKQQDNETTAHLQRSSRFPYYDTVHAIETNSPLAYRNSPGAGADETQYRQSPSTNFISHSKEFPHDRHQQHQHQNRQEGHGDNEENHPQLDMHVAQATGFHPHAHSHRSAVEEGNYERHSEDDNGIVNEEEEEEDLHAELMRLEHVNNALLLALQQEKYEKSVVEKQLQLIQDNVLEVETQNEVTMDNHKIEVLRLKGHIRRLSQENGFEDALRGFEEDLSRVVKEKTLLKKRFTLLEEKLFLLGNGAGVEEEEDSVGGSVVVGDRMLGGRGRVGSAGSDKENTHTSKLNRSFHTQHHDSQSHSGGGHGVNISTSTAMTASTQPLSVVWTAEGIPSAGSNECAVSAKEFRILKHKYKRAEKAKDDISAAYEELKRKERKFMLGAKHSSENSKRFKSLYAENELISEQLHEALTNLDIKTQEVVLLKQEAVALQDAERNIRSERSNILQELSVARQRLRENDAELKDQRYRNRFISKHGYVSSSNGGSGGGGVGGGDSGGRVGPSKHHHSPREEQDLSQQQQQEQILRNNQAYFDLLANSNSAFEHLVPLPNHTTDSKPDAISGIAGSSDAMVSEDNDKYYNA